MPGALDNAAAGGEAPREFLVVSITVADFARAPQAQLSRERGVVLGRYASVERVRKLPGWDGEIEWIMATASDARGVLPHWVQALAVPGQIAKDVPLFLAWMARERAGERHPSPPAAAADDAPADSGPADARLMEALVPTKVVAAPVPAEEAVVRSGTEAATEPVPAPEPVPVPEEPEVAPLETVKEEPDKPKEEPTKPAAPPKEEPVNAPEPLTPKLAAPVAVQS